MATAKKRQLPIGAEIDALWALREKKRALDEQVKVIETQINEASEALMVRMEQDGTDKVTGKMATVSISDVMVGNCTDWDMLNAFIKKTGNFQLYQHRLSDPAVRELFEQKGNIPGVELFKKRKLNLRKV